MTGAAAAERATAGGRGAAAVAERAMAAALRRAAAPGEGLSLRYRPVVDLALGRPHGVEALLRRRDPVPGEVPPGRFVPAAERSGLIGALGLWAAAEAARELGPTLARRPGLGLALNLSALQDRPARSGRSWTPSGRRSTRPGSPSR